MSKGTQADFNDYMYNLKIQIREEVKQMLNQCTLTGNLGADPEVFYSSEGNPVATFNIAFHSSKKKTCWIKVTAFSKLALRSFRNTFTKGPELQ